MRDGDEYRQWFEALPVSERAAIHRAEIVKLHDILDILRLARPIDTYWLASRNSSLAGASSIQSDGDPRRFPFQEYEPVPPPSRSFLGESRSTYPRPAPIGIPLEREIEVERIIGPLWTRWQYLVQWKQRGNRYSALIEDRALMQSLLGRVWGWGWPLHGMVFEIDGGYKFIPAPVPAGVSR